jgi:hypothetical protein
MQTNDAEGTAASVLETLELEVEEYGDHEVLYADSEGAIQRATLREFVAMLRTLAADTVVDDVPVTALIPAGETVYRIG